MPFIEPTRTPQTQALYLQEGERHLRRALRIWPVIACEVEALAVSVEADLTILRASTVRRYRQELYALLDAKIAEKPERAEMVEGARDRVMAALDQRRGRPPCRRTSSRKVRDASPEECGLVLADLRMRTSAPTADDLDHLLPAFLVAEPPLGLRPVEWIGARIEGGGLVVPCAKATNGRACSLTRWIGLGGFEPAIPDAVERMLRLLPGLLARYGSWTRLRDALAERLARSCRRAGVRRLSPYSFRHVALATWKANGLDPLAIAALAGHKTTRMQNVYAGARHGWTAEGGLPEPDPALIAAITAMAANMALEAEGASTSLPVGADKQEPASPTKADDPPPKSEPGTSSGATDIGAAIESETSNVESAAYAPDPFAPMPVPRAAPPPLRPLGIALPAATLFAGLTYRAGSRGNGIAQPRGGSDAREDGSRTGPSGVRIDR